MQDEIDELKTSLKEKNDIIDSLIVAKSTLEKELVQSQTKIENLENELESLIREIKSNKCCIDDLQQEIVANNDRLAEQQRNEDVQLKTMKKIEK